MAHTTGRYTSSPESADRVRPRPHRRPAARRRRRPSAPNSTGSSEPTSPATTGTSRCRTGSTRPPRVHRCCTPTGRRSTCSTPSCSSATCESATCSTRRHRPAVHRAAPPVPEGLPRRTGHHGHAAGQRHREHGLPRLARQRQDQRRRPARSTGRDDRGDGPATARSGRSYWHALPGRLGTARLLRLPGTAPSADRQGRPRWVRHARGTTQPASNRAQRSADLIAAGESQTVEFKSTRPLERAHRAGRQEARARHRQDGLRLPQRRRRNAAHRCRRRRAGPRPRARPHDSRQQGEPSTATSCSFGSSSTTACPSRPRPPCGSASRPSAATTSASYQRRRVGQAGRSPSRRRVASGAIGVLGSDRQRRPSSSTATTWSTTRPTTGADRLS